MKRQWHSRVVRGTSVSPRSSSGRATFRNTARYTADEWNEIGEFSRDGTTWTQVMEIKLRRAP